MITLTNLLDPAAHIRRKHAAIGRLDGPKRRPDFRAAP